MSVEVHSSNYATYYDSAAHTGTTYKMRVVTEAPGALPASIIYDPFDVVIKYECDKDVVTPGYSPDPTFTMNDGSPIVFSFVHTQSVPGCATTFTDEY